MDSKQNLNQPRIKQLMKIVIGAAWIDGVIQPSEREYLHRMAEENALANDPEIQKYLSELKPIKPAECYVWLEEYLGENPTEEDYLKLLESLSGLIYSDGEVQTQEALLLDKLQLLDPANKESSNKTFDKLLQVIQKLYRKAVSQKV
ncbi:TerB family tellurite resistance protein [Gloeothece verrucosa]|uniref:Co-chaperone DjlA N-terminal domain-containing protein n=1 Tax=Gloeothece verrucosa (strain PCC 7822) TaxID=497965 RepID=E0UIJ4_GLOV7|nr:TerB family tellurite resistance protein [Gloeothece verrucosa]ADN12188.1 conserved hypothetical protein [Gloeothece verrucosa PCC 7822]